MLSCQKKKKYCYGMLVLLPLPEAPFSMYYNPEISLFTILYLYQKVINKTFKVKQSTSVNETYLWPISSHIVTFR